MVTTEFFTLPKPRRISWSLLSFSRNEDEYPVLDRLSPENEKKVPELIVFLQKTKRKSPSWSSFSRKRKSWCGLSFCRKQNEIPWVRGGTQKNKGGAFGSIKIIPYPLKCKTLLIWVTLSWKYPKNANKKIGNIKKWGDSRPGSLCKGEGQMCKFFMLI